MNVAVLIVVVLAAIAAYAIWRARRPVTHPDVPEHAQPVEGKANVIAARLELLAGNLESQASELRSLATQSKEKEKEDPRS